MIGILPFLFIMTFVLILMITLWLELEKGICIGNELWTFSCGHYLESLITLYENNN